MGEWRVHVIYFRDFTFTQRREVFRDMTPCRWQQFVTFGTTLPAPSLSVFRVHDVDHEDGDRHLLRNVG